MKRLKRKSSPNDAPPSRGPPGDPTPSTTARDKLLAAGTELLRRDGYAATTVDDICARAGVTKGAFFHHFDSKEALAEACLVRWDCQAAAREDAAPFNAVRDPRKRLLACMDFYIAVLSNPSLLKSCLAGTTVQEVSQTHPALRDAANQCFTGAEQRFKALLDAALQSGAAPRGTASRARRAARRRLDTASLARLWMATIQGSLILAKASGDETVIPRNLTHVKEYIQTLLSGRDAR